MSYTKPCNKCGERISLRQMPQGQWVAFDVSTEESHVCGVKNDPDISVKLSSKKKKEFEEDETIDLGYEDDFLETKKDIEESKTYSNSSGVNYCIDKAIINKKRILIDYYSDFNNENTYREISPIKKFKLNSKNYLQAYCHLRKAERNFLTRSIKTATEMNKKRTTAKLSKPDLNFILKNDEDLNKIKSIPKKEIKVKKELKTKKDVKVKKQIVSNLNPANTFQNFIWKIEDFFGQLFSLAIALGMAGVLVYIFYMAIFE
jgi:hypothetical protein